MPVPASATATEIVYVPGVVEEKSKYCVVQPVNNREAGVTATADGLLTVRVAPVPSAGLQLFCVSPWTRFWLVIV
ncbi:hypothetical protein ASG88_08700 [Nocardioides sp. Soil777]|nr:hypothetical protein ASG88_08700 [Nocardioides sp. Soil777]